MEMFHREGAVHSNAYVKAQLYDSHINNAMSGNAVQEEQIIKVTSDVKVEKQVITVTGFSSQSATGEVQSVTIEDVSVSSDGGSFRFGLYSVYTGKIILQFNRPHKT